MTQAPTRRIDAHSPRPGGLTADAVRTGLPGDPPAGPQGAVPGDLPSGARGAGSTALVPDDLRAARRAATGSRRPWGLALAVYATLVVVVLGWPTPVDSSARDELWIVLDRLHRAGVPYWFGYDLVERLANVAMFVPLGLLVTRVTRRWWWGLAVPAALSGGAELAQHLLRPERFSTWADVAANTAGGALGVVVAVVLMRRLARSRGQRLPAL